MNGAESLIRTFAAHDLSVCFANPGTSEAVHFDTSQYPSDCSSKNYIFDLTHLANDSATVPISSSLIRRPSSVVFS